MQEASDISYENTSQPELYENMDELIAACHRQIELLIEMRRALLLADLLGIPPKDLKGVVSTRRVPPTRNFDPKPWKYAALAVKVGDGEWQNFPLHEVNRRLWPDEENRAYAKWLEKQNPPDRGGR